MKKSRFGDALALIGLFAAVGCGLWVGITVNWLGGVLAGIAVMALAGSMSLGADLGARSDTTD